MHGFDLRRHVVYLRRKSLSRDDFSQLQGELPLSVDLKNRKIGLLIDQRAHVFVFNKSFQVFFIIIQCWDQMLFEVASVLDIL